MKEMIQKPSNIPKQNKKYGEKCEKIDMSIGDKIKIMCCLFFNKMTTATDVTAAKSS